MQWAILAPLERGLWLSRERVAKRGRYVHVGSEVTRKNTKNERELFILSRRVGRRLFLLGGKKSERPNQRPLASVWQNNVSADEPRNKSSALKVINSLTFTINGENLIYIQRREEKQSRACFYTIDVKISMSLSKNPRKAALNKAQPIILG